MYLGPRAREGAAVGQGHVGARRNRRGCGRRGRHSRILSPTLILTFEQFLAFLAKCFVFVYRLGAVEVAANARENLNCELTFGLVAENSS